MFKIIGADGQQYGPVTADQIRRWLAENRVRAETLVQAEGATDWKPLSSFPEFADVRSAPPTMTPPVGTPPVGIYPPPNPRASNKIPAGVCGIILGGFGVHKFILGYTGSGLIMLLVSVLSCGALYPLMHLLGLIEGIIYLTKSDDEFVRLYIDGRKEWF
jgi:TM2 domain-containing membrane protein YozV